jgi:Flp pilus assembly protein TadG
MIVNAIRRRLRREEGASLVEFALIAPILFLLLFGLIDFGFIYNDFLSVRQGVRDGARQGAVANFGTQTSCSNDSFTGSITSTQAKELICTTRNRIGLDASKMRVAVCLADNAGTGCSSNTTVPNPDYAAGRTLAVCAMYPATSRSGFLKPFLGNGVVTTRVAIRIEQTFNTASGSPLPNTDDLKSGFEDLNGAGFPSGKSWGFCVP